MKHPDHITIQANHWTNAGAEVGYVTCSDMQYLAAQIEHMRYDRVEELIGALSRRFLDRSLADAIAGKSKLAQELNEVSEHLALADAALIKAWAICKTHMKEDKK